jgi:hypothetical protein
MNRTDLNTAAAIARDGFLAVEDVLTAEVLEEVCTALDRAEPNAAVLQRAGSVYGMRDLLRRVPEVRRLATSRPIRDLVEPVLGPGSRAVRGLLFDKTPEANWGVPWHRDTTIAVRARRDVAGFGPWTLKAGVVHVRPPTELLERMLTLRIHLDDAGPRNGPLRVSPGSHADVDASADSISAWRERVAAFDCPMRRGGVLMMRPLVLHASATAAVPSRRRVVHLEFAAEELPGGLEWVEACASAGI